MFEKNFTCGKVLNFPHHNTKILSRFLKILVLWDVTPCQLVKSTVPVSLAASIFRVEHSKPS